MGCIREIYICNHRVICFLGNCEYLSFKYIVNNKYLKKIYVSIIKLLKMPINVSIQRTLAGSYYYQYLRACVVINTDFILSSKYDLMVK